MWHQCPIQDRQHLPPHDERAWRTKGEYARLAFAMSLRLCRVTITDLEGVRHSVEVTASTLYEAVALGLAAIRGEEWAGEIAEGLNRVEVTVSTVPVTHCVIMQDFRKWLDRKGGAPREVTHRERIRQILGLEGTP